MKYLTYLCSIILITCFGVEAFSQQTMNFDSLFVRWNNSTIQSLKWQINSSKNSPAVKFKYKNRLEGFNETMELTKSQSFNHNSLRYSFLKELRKNEKISSWNFFVIEANRSGERVEIRNFVVFFESQDIPRVQIYNYLAKGWIVNTLEIPMNFKIDKNLLGITTEFGKGFNQDDIIITQFINGTVKNSKFYLYGTLSDDISIKKILALK